MAILLKRFVKLILYGLLLILTPLLALFVGDSRGHKSGGALSGLDISRAYADVPSSGGTAGEGGSGDGSGAAEGCGGGCSDSGGDGSSSGADGSGGGGG